MTKMNRLKMLTSLKSISPALPNRTIVQSAYEFLFSTDKVSCFNDEICLQEKIEFPFACSIPASELIAALSATEEEFVEIAERDSLILITAKDLSAEISINKENELLALVNDFKKPKKWLTLPDNFIRMLSLCKESTSDDMTQGFLTAVLIENERIISSDDLRITEAKLSSPIGIKQQILLPAGAIANLVSFAPKQMGVIAPWVYFKTNEESLLCAKILPEEYPDPSAFFEIEGETISMPEKLTEIVDQISSFCYDAMSPTGRVDFEISKDVCKIKARNQAGKIEKKISIKYKGEAFSFSVNPSFLNALVKNSTHFIVSSTEGKALFKSESFRHIVLLIQGDK